VNQKNDAMERCSGEWLFNLDADAEDTPELRRSIEKVVYGGSPRGNARSAYQVPRKTWYLGRWMEHCGWYPEYRTRLSRRGRARWQGEDLHEELAGDGPAGRLSGDLLHRPYWDLGEHMDTIRRYTYLWAQREAAAGRGVSWTDIVFRPFFRFVKMYFLRGGFLDSGPGFVASVMGAWYVFLKYARLYEMTRVSR